MITENVSGKEISGVLIGNYFRKLVDMYFKILPLYENGESSLRVYMENLRDELTGCSGIIAGIQFDPLYMSLIATLQFLIGELDDSECTKEKFRQKVFGAIAVCNKLASRYGQETEESK